MQMHHFPCKFESADLIDSSCMDGIKMIHPAVLVKGSLRVLLLKKKLFLRTGSNRPVLHIMLQLLDVREGSRKGLQMLKNTPRYMVSGKTRAD